MVRDVECVNSKGCGVCIYSKGCDGTPTLSSLPVLPDHREVIRTPHIPATMLGCRPTDRELKPKAS